ncbi:hypothetical protein RhiTH_007496 [Rhizoctonia solani]
MSEMKKLAARDYKDMLQCCIPVFEGLLPHHISKRVLDLLFIFSHWHSLGKLRIHSDKTIEIFQKTTKDLCSELRAFSHYTLEYNHLETRKEKEARERRQSQNSGGRTARTSNQKIGKGFSMDTYKVHSIGDYIPTILEYGTTDSYSTQIGELQHRRVKGIFARTNKQGDTTSQMTSIERIQATLRRMKEDLDSLYNPQPQPTLTPWEIDSLSDSNRFNHYNIALSQREFLHLPTWLARLANDPATHLFLPRLRSFMYSRLEPMGTHTQESSYGFQIQYDWVYKHAILGVNYTLYDMRRCTDCIHPASDRHFILVKAANTIDDLPYNYARVLGIFHANVCLSIHQPFQRVDFLWVRWLARNTSYRSGWNARRLDRLSYYAEDPLDTESSPPLDFISPSDVVRAIHLIPAFEAETTQDYLPGNSDLAHDIVGRGDWKYWYAMRFVDRDTMIRYHGKGVGHHGIFMEARTDIEEDTQDVTQEQPNQQDDLFDEEDNENDEDNDDQVSVLEETQAMRNSLSDEEFDEEDNDSNDYESEEDMEPLRYEY